MKSMLVAAGLLIAIASSISHASPDAAQTAPVAADTSGLNDFDFIMGDWSVHHRHISSATHAWVEFDGTSSTRKVMGGAGNVEDNVLNPPSGTYRAAAMRAYDPKTGLWAIWWVDGRSPHGAIDPPVKGRFENGVGAFYSDGTVNGKTIRTRYLWSHSGPDTAHWEQATSADGGKTWDTNWYMDFKRQQSAAAGFGARQSPP
jgi:hypothetical protein